MADSGRGRRGGGSLAGYERLLHHYVFYGAYHLNPVNQWIHIVCVPLILATALLLAHALSPAPGAFLGLLSDRSAGLVLKVVERLTGAPLSIATLGLAVYMLFYLWLTPTLLGVAASCLAFLTFQVAVGVLPLLGDHAVAIATGVHVVCWLAQFYGHGVHEKRAPALLDNLAQAVLMAPIFVFMEVLYKVGLLSHLHRAAVEGIAAKRREITAASKP